MDLLKWLGELKASWVCSVLLKRSGWMEPPTGLFASLWSFIHFLPYFIGLLLLGNIKGEWQWFLFFVLLDFLWYALVYLGVYKLNFWLLFWKNAILRGSSWHFFLDFKLFKKSLILLWNWFHFLLLIQLWWYHVQFGVLLFYTCSLLTRVILTNYWVSLN